MILGTKFRENTEAITGGVVQTVQFDKGLPKYAISLWTFLITGAGAHNGIGGDGWDRYQDSIDNDQIIDMTPSETRALFEYIYSRLGGAVPAAAAVAWDWPFYLLAMLAPTIAKGMYPEIGFPGNSDKVHRHQANANAVAGTIKLGWKKSNREPDFSPLMVGRTLSGMTAATGNNRYEINWQPVPTVGFVINGFAHFDRIRLYVADASGFAQEMADLLHDQILELLDPYNVQSITDPIFIPLDQPMVLPKGSYFLFDTNGGYTGAERIVPIQLVPESAGSKLG